MKTKLAILTCVLYSFAAPAFAACKNTVFSMNKLASGFGQEKAYPNMPEGWAVYGVPEESGDGYFITTFFSEQNPHLIWLHANGEAEDLNIGAGQYTQAVYQNGNELWTFNYSYVSKIVATGVNLVTKKLLPPRYGLTGSMFEAQTYLGYLYFQGGMNLEDNGKPIGFNNRMNLRTGVVEPLEFKSSMLRKFATHDDKLYFYGPTSPATRQHPNNDKNFLEMDLDTLELTDWKSPFPWDIGNVAFYGDTLIAVAHTKYDFAQLSEYIRAYDVKTRQPSDLFSWEQAPTGKPDRVMVIGGTVLFDSFQSFGPHFAFPDGRKSYVIAYDIASRTFRSLIDVDSKFKISPAVVTMTPNQLLLGAYCGAD